jgi:hypothetical protein
MHMQSNTVTRGTLGIVLVALTAGPAAATDPALKVTVVAQEGDVLIGVGNLTLISNLAVDSTGKTLIEVDTNNVNTDIDTALLLDGVLLHQEGDLLPLPLGASIDTFDTVNLTDGGNSGWNFFLDGTAGSTDDSGIYFNTTLLIQEGDVSAAAGFSAGTVYTGFFECKINESNDILVMASVDDPAIASTTDRALVILDTLGNETVFLKEADLAPGLGGPLISDFGTGPHNFDFNDNGDILYFADTDAATTDDGVIYLNTTILAREGQAAPIAGRLWSSLSSPELALNNQGDYVFSGSMDGDTATNTIIVLNGQKFIQEGDTHPDIAPFTFTSFGSGPILICDRHDPTDTPDVLWYGDWNDSDTTIDTGLFLNDKLIFQEGVDSINGVVIEDVRGISDGFTMSPDGRYLLVELNLVGGIETAVLVDRGPWTNLGQGLAGSTQSVLRASGSLVFNDPVSLCVSNAPPSSPAVLVIGGSQLNAPFFGGTLVPFPNVFFFGLASNTDGQVQLSGPLSNVLPPNSEIVMQFWIADGATPAGFASTNGVVGIFP